MLVQLSYAIGVAKPLSINVETYGTATKTDAEIVAISRVPRCYRRRVLDGAKDCDSGGCFC